MRVRDIALLLRIKLTDLPEKLHQIFVEPEGWNTVEVYVNGFSTSLPVEVQYEALHKVRGFENAKFFRPGYAIEYDYFSYAVKAH